MKIKTPTGDIELGDWTKKKGIYWFRLDLGKPSRWAKKHNFGCNNAVGFLVDRGGRRPPRFFGEDVNFLIERWDYWTDRLPLDIEEAKKAMDKFLEQFKEQ